MIAEEFGKLILKNEHPKLDFKRDYESKKENSEYLKDIISLANGNVNTVGETAYLIFGIEEVVNGDNIIYGIDSSKTFQQIERELIQNLDNYLLHPIQDLKVEEIILDSKKILFITIPFQSYLLLLKKDLKGTQYKKGNLLYRVGDNTRFVEDAYNCSLRKSFEKAFEKFIPKELLDNSTKESVLFEEWSDDKAKEIVLNEIDKYERIKKDYFGFEENSIITHNIIDFLSLDDINHDKKISIIETYPDEHDCHACGVNLSFIEFIKVSAGWILNQIDINVMTAGSWGKRPKNISVSSIGYNKFGIKIEDSYGNQGVFSDYLSIYTLVAGEYRKVFLTETQTSNYGAVKSTNKRYFLWDGVVEFLQEGKSYYNLILLRKGIRNKEKFKEKILYTFDDIEYKKREVTEYIL